MSARRKAFGLVAVAMVAMGLVASSALAAEFHFEKEAVRVTGKAEGTHTLDLAGGTLKCTEASFESLVVPKTITELTVVGSYGNCVMFGGQATVSTNGCDFAFLPNGELRIGNIEPAVSCIVKPLKIHTTFEGKECNITMQTQMGFKGLSYKNIGSGSAREVTMEGSVEGLFYSAEGSLCKETGSKSNGRYTAINTVFKAERSESKEPVGMWWE